MKLKVILLTLLLSIPMGNAFAITIGGCTTSATEYCLGDWNIPISYAGNDYVQVDIGSILDKNGVKDTTLTVTFHQNGGNASKAINMFGYNTVATNGTGTDGKPLTANKVNTTTSTDGGITNKDLGTNLGSWSFNFDGINYDGFGAFNSHKDLATQDITSNSFMITLNGIASFTPDSGGHTFAAHVMLAQCTGFVTDTAKETSNTYGSSSNCNATVPEPSSLLLLGSGLIGLAIWGRKRFERV